MAEPSEEVIVNPIVRGRLCICGQPAPNGLTQHPECATEELAARVRARSGAEVAREQRQRDAELTAAVLAGRRLALAQVETLLKALEAEYDKQAQSTYMAHDLCGSVSRAQGVGEALKRLRTLMGDGGGE